MPSDKILEQALAVKRGSKKLADIPDGDRAGVRRALNGSQDGNLASFARRSTVLPKSGTQVRLRRAVSS